MSDKPWDISRVIGGIHMAADAFCKVEMPQARLYVVGSAIFATTRPRDIDIRIVMDDRDFWKRYGFLRDDSGLPQIIWPRDERWWKFVEETRRVETFFSYCCGDRNVDLAITSRSKFQHYVDDPKYCIYSPIEDEEDHLTDAVRRRYRPDYVPPAGLDP